MGVQRKSWRNVTSFVVFKTCIPPVTCREWDMHITAGSKPAPRILLVSLLPPHSGLLYRASTHGHWRIRPWLVAIICSWVPEVTPFRRRHKGLCVHRPALGAPWMLNTQGGSFKERMQNCSLLRRLGADMLTSLVTASIRLCITGIHLQTLIIIFFSINLSPILLALFFFLHQLLCVSNC